MKYILLRELRLGTYKWLRRIEAGYERELREVIMQKVSSNTNLQATQIILEWILMKIFRSLLYSYYFWLAYVLL